LRSGHPRRCYWFVEIGEKKIKGEKSGVLHNKGEGNIPSSFREFGVFNGPIFVISQHFRQSK